MNIFVVHAATTYEGSAPICAYLHQADAEAFARQCTEYHATRGECLRQISNAINANDDAALEGLMASDDAWLANHPAGMAGNCADTFEVHPLQLKPGFVNGEAAWTAFVDALPPGPRANVLDSMRRGESLTRLAFDVGVASERKA